MSVNLPNRVKPQFGDTGGLGSIESFGAPPAITPLSVPFRVYPQFDSTYSFQNGSNYTAGAGSTATVNATVQHRIYSMQGTYPLQDTATMNAFGNATAGAGGGTVTQINLTGRLLETQGFNPTIVPLVGGGIVPIAVGNVGIAGNIAGFPPSFLDASIPVNRVQLVISPHNPTIIPLGAPDTDTGGWTTTAEESGAWTTAAGPSGTWVKS